jgi:hypothetical protein
MRCDIRVFIVHRYARAAQTGVTSCVCCHAKVRTDEIWLHKKMVIGTPARVKVNAPAKHRDNGRRLGQLVLDLSLSTDFGPKSLFHFLGPTPDSFQTQRLRALRTRL